MSRPCDALSLAVVAVDRARTSPYFRPTEEVLSGEFELWDYEVEWTVVAGRLYVQSTPWLGTYSFPPLPLGDPDRPATCGFRPPIELTTPTTCCLPRGHDGNHVADNRDIDGARFEWSRDWDDLETAPV